MKALSPGKLILTGEHAVVYGCPAIAMAIDRFAETTITPQLSKFISFNLLNFRYNDSFTIQTLREIKNRLIDKYQLFLGGDCGIRDVLQTPFELAQFAFINFLDHLNSKIIDGLNIKTQSNIPIGCGMGSSAAVILSVLGAIALHFKIELKKERYFQLAHEVEKLQHGFPSGLDVYTSLYGGSVYFKEGKASSYDLPNIPMYIVNTGTPVVGTGECVSHVAKQFKHDVIWHDFEAVTLSILNALEEKSLVDVQYGLKENHRLLVKIGVVPEKVQHFIDDIEKDGAAAKVCGAGAVAGEMGGVVLIVSESKQSIQPICQRYGYELTAVQKDIHGLHVE